MGILREAAHRVLSLMRWRRDETELSEEIRAHLDFAIEDYRARGLSEAEARRAALLDFGGVQQARELHRESRGLPMLETLLGDVRYGLRTLRRDRGLTGFALVIVALGVAACSVVFSVTSVLLLEPLPFRKADELVWIANGTSLNLSAQTVQVGNLEDLAYRSQTLAEIGGFFAFYGAGDLRVDGAEGPQRLTGVPITGNFLTLLGVDPVLGRGFSEAEVAAEEPVVLLSHRLWRSRFGGRADVLDAPFSIDGRPVTIVGVLPESFDFEAIFTPGRAADLFRPYALNEDNHRQGNTLALVGRLRDGLSVRAAQEESTRIAEAISEETTDERRNSFHPMLRPLHEQVSGGVRPSLLVLSGAVSLLMLIVCANLSNLLLARASGRRRELAVQVALGAGRLRVVRRVLTETLMLSVGGALLGLALAVLAIDRLGSLRGTEVPLLSDVQVDPTVVGFTILLAALTGMLFGIAPALQAASTDPAEALRSGAGGRATGDRRARWFRQTLVVGEVALACILLMGVGLLLRSLMQAMDTELGFDRENLIALRVDPSRGTAEREAGMAYYDRLLQAAQQVPGIASVGLTDALPFGDNFGWRTWNAEPAGADDDYEAVFPLVRIVDHGYWDTLGLQLVAGRTFSATDEGESEPVAIVNRPLAELLFPEQPAVGQLLETSGREYRIVGVVEEARYFGLERASGPEMYFSVRQGIYTNSLDLVVRTSQQPEMVMPSLRRALLAADPGLPTHGMRTMEGLVQRSTFERRSVLSLLSGFALFGLVLASLGVYSVISYSVSLRSREMGVRLAFGATERRLSAGIVWQTLRPALLGVSLGVVGAWLLARALTSLLYGVSPGDPLTYSLVLVVLLASATAASYVPARRAARLDVASVLRGE